MNTAVLAIGVLIANPIGTTGATSYIGNGPNFMVKALAEAEVTDCEDEGAGRLRMPSFFGYLGWSGAILMPLFVIVTLIFFR